MAIARAVRKKISRSGFWAQKEISNAGRLGSSGAAGSSPWVRAKTKTRIPAVVSKTYCTKKDEVIAGYEEPRIDFFARKILTASPTRAGMKLLSPAPAR